MRISSKMTRLSLVEVKQNVISLLVLQWNMTQIVTFLCCVPQLTACREKFTHGPVRQTAPEREVTNISDGTVNSTNDWAVLLSIGDPSLPALGSSQDFCSIIVPDVSTLAWSGLCSSQDTHTFLRSDWTLVTSSHDPRPAAGKHTHIHTYTRVCSCL